MIDLQGTLIALHGPPKIGKTQFVDSMPGPVFFIATEHGHKFVSESSKKALKYLPSGKAGWELFLKIVKSDYITKHKFKTVAIDTAAKLYEREVEYVCSKHNIDHPSDAPHGKGWHFARQEFSKGISLLVDRCAEIGATLVVIDHTKVATINLGYKEYNKAEFGMPTQPREIFLPIADHNLFLGYDDLEDKVSVDTLGHQGSMRRLWFGGNESIEAGTRDPNIQRLSISKIPKDRPYDYVVSQLNKPVEKKKKDV